MFHLCFATQIDRASGTKRRKHSSKEKIALISFDDDVDEANSSNGGEEESCLTKKRSSIGITPSFVAHRVIASPTHSTHRSTVSSTTQQLFAATWKLESQYLRPLLVAEERTEATTKCSIIN